MHHNIAVIVYGPPGSGKGTQAELLSRKLGLVHFDTGRFLEAAVHDPARQKDSVIARERKLFDAGMLMTPSFVFREVRRGASRIAKAGLGIAFSGSPRTLYEAEGLMPILEKLYGKKNIHVIILNVPVATSVERNTKRVICTICHAPLLTAYHPSKKPKHCPICAGPFYKRVLDNAKTMKVRIKEYEARTKPIFKFMEKRGYRPLVESGLPAPYRIFEHIAKTIKVF